MSTNSVIRQIKLYATHVLYVCRAAEAAGCTVQSLMPSVGFHLPQLYITAGHNIGWYGICPVPYPQAQLATNSRPQYMYSRSYAEDVTSVTSSASQGPHSFILVFDCLFVCVCVTPGAIPYLSRTCPVSVPYL